MTNQIQTGLLAYGMSGRIFHAPFISTHPGFALRGITERHQKKAQQDYPGIISYDSVEELLRDPAIELVIVNTPSNTHFNLASQALRAGKHVLIEKPLTASVADTKALHALSHEVNRQVFPYQNRRWDSDFLAVRQVIESGQLGRLIEVQFRFDRYKSSLNVKVFKETPIPGSGLQYDLGPHLIDQAISLFGEPSASHKVVGSFRSGSQVDDYFSLRLLYPAGPVVTLTSGLLVADPLPAFVVHGTTGSFIKPRSDVQEAQLDQSLSPLAENYGREASGMEGRLTVVGPGDTKTTTLTPALKGDYTQLFEAVYQAIRNSAPYPIREEHMLWQSRLLEQKADHPLL